MYGPCKMMRQSTVAQVTDAQAQSYAQSCLSDQDHSSEITSGSPKCGCSVVDDGNDLKYKLRELEVSLPGPESDICDSSYCIIKSEMTRWNENQIAEMIPKLNLKDALIHCAYAVSEEDMCTAQNWMEVLVRMVSVSGEPMQRLGAYMLEGLRARFEMSGSMIYKALRPRTPTGGELLTYMSLLYQICPYWKFAYMSSHVVIKEALMHEPRIHIIDFQIEHGRQWVSLIQEFACRPGGPPLIRITGVDDAQSNYARGGGLHIVGKRLSDVAASYHVPFEFVAAGMTGCEVELENLRIRDGEAIAVTFPYVLQHIPDESVSTENHRDRLLRLVRSLSPKIMTIVEQESNTNTCSFYSRFVECVDYYTAMFESIDAGCPRDDKQRINTEMHCVARDIVNMIACEGAERVERHELLGKWKSRLMMAGFTPYQFGPSGIGAIKNLLKDYNENYRVEEFDGALYLGWKKRALVTSSAWRSTNSSDISPIPIRDLNHLQISKPSSIAEDANYDPQKYDEMMDNALAGAPSLLLSSDVRSYEQEMESPPEVVDSFAAGTTERVKDANLEQKLGQVADEHESLPQHLKRLFLYCSLFPFGYEFRKDEFVQLWIAEGFIRERQRERMEDTAGEHFNSLEKEGFFVISRCDFTMDFDSVLSAPADNPSNFLYKVNPIKHSLLEDTISSGNYFKAVDGKLDGASEMTRHLSLIGEDIDGMDFGILQNFKHLRTLHMLSCSGSSMKHVPRDLCFTLTFLRTLNLSGTLISELPSSIGNVKSLRYIDASHTPIARLPESIDSLHNLQTIKLRGCIHFVQLPKGMKKLSNLRHIDLDIIRQLDSMPGHVGNLTNLQTLPAFLVGRDDGCRVGELKNLNDLKGSFNISRLENVLSKEEAEEAALIDKKCIHRLELRWSDMFVEHAQQEKILECLQPHSGLKELQIRQYSGSVLPTWIGNPSFADLVVITLYRCRNCVLPCMGQLPALKSLSIIEVNEVKEINHQFLRNVPVDHAFPKLERLEIDIMLTLKEWKDIQMGDLPSLVKLTMDSCPELVTIPPISCLKSLKQLEFRRCPKLLSLPTDGLPTSLESFVIVDCHKLKEWCLNSEHRSMFCHVPSIWFDNDEVPVFTSNTTPPQEMPSGIPDSGVTLKESSDISQPSSLTVDNRNDDGYNWRKYGQKQVKGSEFPRSYYKCTHLSCPVKKKVERSLDGRITEIVYKSEHNHQRPQSKRPKDSGNQTGNVQVNHDLASQVHGGGNLNKSKERTYSMSKQGQESSQAISGTSDIEEVGDAESEEVGDAETEVEEKDEDESAARRRDMEVRHLEPASSHRTVTEPRCIVQTTSEVDLVDDGYMWRKYGQKVFKGNPYPRSYYKCTFRGCNVRKHIERAATDPKAVITTYEGKHNHDVPASRSISGRHHAANNNASNLRSGNPGTEKHASVSKMDPRNNDQQPVARLRLKEEQIT